MEEEDTVRSWIRLINSRTCACGTSFIWRTMTRWTLSQPLQYMAAQLLSARPRVRFYCTIERLWKFVDFPSKLTSEKLRASGYRMTWRLSAPRTISTFTLSASSPEYYRIKTSEFLWITLGCRFSASLSLTTSVNQTNYIALLEQRRAILSSIINILTKVERISTFLPGKKKRGPWHRSSTSLASWSGPRKSEY